MIEWAPLSWISGDSLRLERIRVVTGVVGRNVELEDDTLGFVASLDKNPQKARVLLRLALLQQRSAADVQRIFDEY